MFESVLKNLQKKKWNQILTSDTFSLKILLGIVAKIVWIFIGKFSV